MKKVKRVLCMLLVCCLLVGMLPTFALATGQDYVWLDELQIVDSDRYTGNMGDSFIDKIGTRNGTIDTEGNSYSHGLEAWIARWNYKNESSWAWCTYDLNGKYDTLSGSIGILAGSYNKTNFDTTLEIWGDNVLLYSLALHPNMANQDVSLNIVGVDTLKISLYDNESASGGTSFSLGNFKLYGNDVREPSDELGDGKTSFQEHSYQLISTKMSWVDAKAYCESLGGHLVTITSQAEQNFVCENFTKKYGAAMIGLSDAANEGDWKWVTGEAFSFSNWDSGEPNNEGNEDYVLMNSDGTWNDGHLEREKWIFICEWDSNVSGEFRFASNTTMNCFAKNSTVDIYAGYYVDDALTSRNYQAIVGDADILQVKNNGWDSLHGQHFSLTAKKTGSTTLTVIDPSTGATGSLNLNVVDSEVMCSFDNVPQMTIEKGKTTNFYNYSGMVVDDFKYKEVKAADGSVDHYAVTMTVYNTLDLYGAITAYDADGNIYDYCIIDKFTSMDSSFVDSVETLIKSTGDLFYLIGNNKYYSGESISKKTEIKSSSPINVPTGGYLEISNNVSSPIALFANMAGITIDFMATTGSLASSVDAKEVIVDQLLIDAFTKDYAGEKAIEAIKKLANQELKNGNWSLDTFGDGIQALLKVLEQSGIDFMELLQKEIASVKGLASIAESVGMDIIPTGQLINLLYGFSDVGELIIEATTFNRSVDYPMGIYLYTSVFSDVSTKAYYSDPVQWALMNDITSGTSATTFSPDASCTRAQAVTFLWRAAGSPKPSSTKNPFTDVKAGTYYYDAVLWAVEQGITSGSTSTTFSPDAVCNRGQIVTFLYRANGSPTTSGNAFSDVSSSAYYSSAVKWAVAEGITSGTSSKTFSPSANCTRGQIVTFLYRSEN